MSWVYLVIFAHLLWALNNIFDRYVMEKRMRNPFVYTVLGLIAACLSLFLFIPWLGWKILPLNIILLTFLAGIAYFLGTYFYLKSIQTEEASRISILSNVIPLFNFGLAWLFMNEMLTIVQLLALLFLLFGGVCGSIHIKSAGHWHFSKAFFLMILSAFLFAIVDVTLRYTSQNYPSGSLLLYLNTGILVTALLVFVKPKFLYVFKEDLKNLDWKLWIGLILTGFLARVGLLLSIKALSVAPVSLATAFSGFQVLFVFVMAFVITKFAPHLMKEELDKKNILIKLGSFVLMLVGVIILTL